MLFYESDVILHMYVGATLMSMWLCYKVVMIKIIIIVTEQLL